MNILLIYSEVDSLSITPRSLINIEPLGLEYLAGNLNDHDVTILDMKVERNLEQKLVKNKPDIVGMTGTAVHHLPILAVLHQVKLYYPDTVTVVGGTHATLVPGDFYSPSVDVIIPGQHPEIFQALVEAVEQRKSLEKVPGLIIRSEIGWHSTAPVAVPSNLNHLPIPRRDLTAPYRHRYQHLMWRPVGLMVTSVGCPHACRFCPCPVLTGRKVLRRSPERVLEELSQIPEPYVYIGDDNLFFDHRHAHRIADMIKREGLKKQYYVLSRADDIVKHPHLIEKWKDIGLKKVFIGLESPSDNEIKALNKRATVEGNNRAIEILHANRIDPLGAFVIHPNYTKDDFNRILDYMDRMGIYYFEFTILTAFPGTPFYKEEKNRLISKDTRLFDLAHSLFPTRLPIKKFYREFHRLHSRAARLRRALKIRPVVSPLHRLALLRQAPSLFGLFVNAKRAYRSLNRLQSKENP